MKTTTPPNITGYQEQVAIVADAVSDLIQRIRAHGLHPTLVLIGAHSAVVANMTAELGGDIAAEHLEQAAQRVKGIPSLADQRLAAATPAGTA